MNTPPMFAIYVTGKVLRWMREQGGVAGMEERAARRSGAVYEAIDGSDGFYRSPVEPAHRSHMNVVFRTPSDELDAAFLAGAEEDGTEEPQGPSERRGDPGEHLQRDDRRRRRRPRRVHGGVPRLPTG